MRRSSSLLILLAIALAAGVGWIATDTGPVEGPEAENLRREQNVARAAAPDAELADPTARRAEQADPEPEEAAQNSLPGNRLVCQNREWQTLVGGLTRVCS